MTHETAKGILIDFVEHLRILYPYKNLLLLEISQENLEDFFTQEEEILKLEDYLLPYNFTSAKTKFYDDEHEELHNNHKLLAFSNFCWFADRLEELNLGLRFSLEEKSLIIKRNYILDTIADHLDIIEVYLIFHKTKPPANKIPKRPPTKPRYLRLVILFERKDSGSLIYPTRLLTSIEKTEAFNPIFSSAIEAGFKYIEIYTNRLMTLLPNEKNILATSPRFNILKFKGEKLYAFLSTQQQKLGFDIFLNKRVPFFFRAILGV